MVISVSSNISEASIDEFFHNTEVSVLNVCHEMEMYNARYKYFNESDGNKKDSVFKKFVETIKQKAIELFNKAYQSILSIYNNFYAKKNKKAAEKVSSKDVANYMYSKITKNDLVLYDTLNMKVDIDQTDLNSVQDFMNSFKIDKSASKNEIEKAIQGSTNNKSSIKLLNDEKKSFLDDINKQYKDGSISVEEKTTKIKRLMNRYTAELKCQVHNNKTYISVINELIKSGPISDSNEDKSNQSNNSSERKLLTSSPESLGNTTDIKPEEEQPDKDKLDQTNNSSNDTKSKQNEDSNKNKSDQSKGSSYNKQELFKELKEYIDDGEEDYIISLITDSLQDDPSGKLSDSLIRYGKKLDSEFLYKDKYARKAKAGEVPYREEKSKWNESYLNVQINLFRRGFRTRSQYEYIKRVANYVYGNKS